MVRVGKKLVTEDVKAVSELIDCDCLIEKRRVPLLHYCITAILESGFDCAKKSVGTNQFEFYAYTSHSESNGKGSSVL